MCFMNPNRQENQTTKEFLPAGDAVALGKIEMLSEQAICTPPPQQCHEGGRGTNRPCWKMCTQVEVGSIQLEVSVHLHATYLKTFECLLSRHWRR